jgi:glycopeptide antibiotics resistance protein
MLKRYTLFCQYEERPYAHVYAKWAMVFALIAFALTLSPFHFEIASSNSFSWKHGPFDLFVNLFLLFPVGFFAVLAKQERKALDILLYLALGLGLSLSIESLQLLIPERTSQYWDVICNTISVMLGVIVGAVIKPALNNKQRHHTPSQVLLVNMLIAVTILLVTYSIQHQTEIQMFAITLLLLICCLISGICINNAIEHEKPQHMQAFVSYTVFAALLTMPLLLNHPFIMLSMILTFALLSFFTTLIGYNGRGGKKFATTLGIIICAGFTYLILAELSAIAAGLMPSTANSTADSGGRSTNHFAVGTTLIMGLMMLSILLDGARYILTSHKNYFFTKNNS